MSARQESDGGPGGDRATAAIGPAGAAGGTRSRTAPVRAAAALLSGVLLAGALLTGCAGGTGGADGAGGSGGREVRDAPSAAPVGGDAGAAGLSEQEIAELERILSGAEEAAGTAERESTGP